MQIILKQTIDNLGEEGDVVKVKPGYFRNYLAPRRMAVEATAGNLTVLEQEKQTISSRRAKQRAEAEALAKKIAGNTVTIEQRVGAENRLFGSVTTGDIAEKLALLGIEVDKRNIMLADPIKELGDTTVSVKCGYQVSADITVQVVALGQE